MEVRDETGVLISVAGAKERQLLAALATACPAVVSVDRLCDMVWDGDPPPTARKSLQAHVVRLRSALEPDRPHGSPGRYVVRRQSGYALALERDDLDCLKFADLGARGRALLTSGDASQARQALGQALDLWRGEPYADWPDADVRRSRASTPGGHLDECDGIDVGGGAGTRQPHRGHPGAGADGRRAPAARELVVAARRGPVPKWPAGRRDGCRTTRTLGARRGAGRRPGAASARRGARRTRAGPRPRHR